MALEPSHSCGGLVSPATMEPVDYRLVQIQDEIRSAFSWSVESDLNSAQMLKSACNNPRFELKLSGKVAIVGADAKKGVSTDLPMLVADGAIGAIEDLSGVVAVVSDGDGFPHLDLAIKAKLPIFLHAHGDNIESWTEVLAKIDEEFPVNLTHQTPSEIEGMYNPGGFTDGDRAVCIALALGAEEIELIGFSTDQVGIWSGVTDKKRKLKKLKWMRRVLSLLSLDV